MLLIVIAFLIAFSFVFHFVDNYFRKGLVRDLAGRHVLITGCDTGFGRKLAIDLARQGSFVVHAGCFTQAATESLRKEHAGRSSSTLRTLLLDVTSDDSVAAARKTVEKDLPSGQGLWALVNNAGIARGIVFEFASFEDYRAVFDVNFYGLVRVTNAFLPLVQTARGRVVNLISICGRFSLIAGPYSCSKFAAQAYSDGLRRQMAPLGVKVSIVEPGFYPTNITSTKHLTTDIDRTWAALSDDVRRSYGKEYLDKVKMTFENQSEFYPLASGNRIHHVTDSIQHAISSRHPKARYVCGLDAHIIYRPAATVLPDWIIDPCLAFMKEMQAKRVHIRAGSKLT